MMDRACKYRAFTLIELLAVASVIAMAGIGTVLLLIRGNQNVTVLKTGQELTLAARSARIHAVQYGQNCKLVLDEESGRFFVAGQNTDSETPEEETVIKTPYSKPVRMPEAVKFEKIAILGQLENQTEIEFRPNGSAQTAIIQIGDGKNHATITILEATGRIKMTPGELESLMLDQADLDEVESAY